MRCARGQRRAARPGAALATLAAAAPAAADDAQRVERVLAQTPLIDGHNDLPCELRVRFSSDLASVDLAASTAALAPPTGSPPLMTDIPRLRQGRVGAQFWSVWIPVEIKGPQAVQKTLEQIDLAQPPSPATIARSDARAGQVLR